MEKEFELFIREKRYIQNVSENTILFYRTSYKAFKKHSTINQVADLSKINLLEFIATMRENGISAAGVNAYIRGTNPFLTWLFENELTSEHFKIKKQKCEKRIMKTFTDAQVKAIVNYKPKNVYETRLHILLLLLLNTGVRINEALTLHWSDVDFENLLITVSGKGNNPRIVPFSVELRKHLYKFKKSAKFEFKFELVFATRTGGKLMYDNLRRGLNTLIDHLGIEGYDGSFHAFRRCFATSYIKSGGNPLILQRLMGHTTLKQTNEYVQLITEDLSAEHQRTSLLNRLR